MSAGLPSACLIYITFHARCMNSKEMRYDSIIQHTRRNGKRLSDIVTTLSIRMLPSEVKNLQLNCVHISTELVTL